MLVSVFRLTRLAAGESTDALVAQGRGPGDAPDDALEVVQAPGLRARPLVRDSTEALVVELPAGDRFAFVIDKALPEGAVALEEGETQLRGCARAAAVVRLRASGDVEVTAAPGRAVILAGGERAVARQGDAVRVTIPMGALIPPGAPGGPLPAAPMGLTVEGVVVEGNERVRA